MEVRNENFVDELKNKNEKALEFVVRNYGSMMRSAIRRILYAYPEDAEECFYDSLLKVWENAGSFDEKRSSFTNWAVAVAKFSALDRFRKLAKIEPMTDIDEIQIADDKHFTDNDVFNGFFSELISCLSDEDKILFIRLFWYGETYDEISRKLKKDKSILFNRVSRGKKKIIKRNRGLFEMRRTQ